ncbi:SoxR reducing system RseC family protein [candidate division WOR-3 bacterium]|nr:SoxR reducing system RseC family protein [candidate division WOR-3 bacterium]
MVEDIGKVTEIKNRIATVEIPQKTTCSGCLAKGICFPNAAGRNIIEAENILDAKKGDTVKVSVRTSISLKAGLLLFILPVVFFIAGFLLVQIFVNSELAGFGGGIVFLIGSFFFLKFLNNKISKGAGFKPIITQILRDIESYIDPVCGMEVYPHDGAIALDYRGHIYYFCSEKCKDEFKKNTERYIER